MAKYPAGTLDLVKIQDALYDWINGITQGVLDDPIQIIWRNQSEPLPARPCVTLKFISGPSPTDRDPAVFLNAANAPINAGMQMEAVLSVQVFGNTKIHRPMAYQLCVDIVSSLFSKEVLRKLHQGGVAIQGKGNVTNLTALEETQYEERAGFELDLGMAQNIVDESTTIQTVNLEREVNGEDLPGQTINLP